MAPHKTKTYTLLWTPQRTPRSMLALERNPEVRASTPDEDLFDSDCRGIPRGPSRLKWIVDLYDAPLAGP